MKLKKYYTPDIEEVYIGFELEHKNTMQENEWKKEVVDSDMWGIAYSTYEETPEDYPNEIRVKYLDKGDIEQVLGVKQLKGDDVELNFQILDGTDNFFYEFDYDTEDKVLVVEKYVKTEENIYNCYTLFKGIIKNKSELKRLFSRINIKQTK